VLKLIGTIVTVALLAGGQSAAKPNFSGEWKMNIAKSDFGQLPPPTFITRTITHVEPALTIVEEQQSQIGDQKATRKYVTDGSETTFDANGAVVKSSAAWTENTLVVISTVDLIGVTFNDKMSLSADGKTMTSQIRITSDQGNVDLTVVFDRQ
jgi:hypothetical protein